MSAYEELVAECVTVLAECFGADSEDESYVKAILDTARRRLETVTQEMREGSRKAYESRRSQVLRKEAPRPDWESEYWTAMLRASPLVPPQ